LTGSSAALSLSKSVALEMLSAALIDEEEELIFRNASGSSDSMLSGWRLWTRELQNLPCLG